MSGLRRAKFLRATTTKWSSKTDGKSYPATFLGTSFGSLCTLGSAFHQTNDPILGKSASFSKKFYFSGDSLNRQKFSLALFDSRYYLTRHYKAPNNLQPKKSEEKFGKFSKNREETEDFSGVTNDNFEDEISEPSAEENLVKSRYQTYAAAFLESPWERKIKVHLLDSKGKFVGKVSKAEARKRAFDEELVLVHLKGTDFEEPEEEKKVDTRFLKGKEGFLGTDGPKPVREAKLPVYQLMERKYAQEAASKLKPQKTGRKEHQIKISSKILHFDLDRKIEKIKNWLKSGCDVRVNIIGGALDAVKSGDTLKKIQEAVPTEIGKVTNSPDLPEKGSSILKLLISSTVKPEKNKED